jgi:hypothetical protein
MDCAQLCPVGKLEKLLLATDRSQFSEGAGWAVLIVKGEDSVSATV